MSVFNYIGKNGVLFEENDPKNDPNMITVSIKIDKDDWDFYRKFFNYKRSQFELMFENTPSGPKKIIKLYL